AANGADGAAAEGADGAAAEGVNGTPVNGSATDGTDTDGAAASGVPAAAGPVAAATAPVAPPAPVVPPAVPWRAVVVFVVLAIGLAWAACSPMWISGEGLQDPRFSLWTIVMMYTPTVAALVTVFLVHRPRSVPRLLGLW